MVGIPGSGKSFFAKKFSDTFSAPYIEATGIAAYAPDEEATAGLVQLIVGELLKTGQSIVIDAGGESRKDRAEIAKYLRAHGYEPLFVWVQVDQETAWQRVNRDRNKQGMDFEAELRRFSPPHQSEKAVVISGKHTYASQAKIILKHLAAPRAEISSHTKPPVRPAGQSIVIR